MTTPRARSTVVAPTRRQMIQSGLTVGGGLLLGFRWGTAPAWADEAAEFMPNAFVRIGTDDSVTVIAKHIEFGQGVYSGLATILAEELDADWGSVRVEAAPADASRYNNLFFGPVQATGGSTAIANSWMQLRQAGAAARAMLVEAASREWGVDAAGIEVERGVVRHPASGRSASFGELVERAATLEPPSEPTLKSPDDFRLIGTSVPRVDVPAKCDGTARFTMDFAGDDVLTALIARPSRFGGQVASFDAAKVRQVDGVVDIVQVPRGVAVIAKGFWAAKRGRDALEVEWDESAAERRGSEELWNEYRGLLDEPGTAAVDHGDAAATLERAERVIEATYEFPYLAHAPMEPLDCVARLRDGRLDLWAGSQIQTIDQGVAAAMAGLTPDKVAVHTELGGGSFGRRATPDGDVAGEAASIAKASGLSVPIKLLWTREDDIRGGRYRPMYAHRLRAALDDAGEITAWEHRIVGQSIVSGTAFEGALVVDGIDMSIVEGAIHFPYAIPNTRIDYHAPEVGVPVLWWRSVGHTHNAYAIETFLDEVLAAAGRDPLTARRELLGDEHPRHLAVLERAASEAGWGDPVPAGRARGIVVHSSFASFVAQVVEISLAGDGMPKVERIVCAVDCGVPINPDNIAAQMEGGAGFGLGAVLHNEITLDEGRVVQSNFHDYRPLRIGEMPTIETHVIQSTEAPTGVGEIAVPTIGPAVANAYAALTGKRLRKLPFAKEILGRTA